MIDTQPRMHLAIWRTHLNPPLLDFTNQPRSHAAINQIICQMAEILRQLHVSAKGNGEFIEKRYRRFLPELGLAIAITKASPTVVGKWKIRSSTKLNLFYGVGLGLLLISTVLSFFIVGKNSDRKSPAEVSTKVDNPDTTGIESAAKAKAANLTPKDKVTNLDKTSPKVDSAPPDIPTVVPSGDSMKDGRGKPNNEEPGPPQ